MYNADKINMVLGDKGIRAYIDKEEKSMITMSISGEEYEEAIFIPDGINRVLINNKCEIIHELCGGRHLEEIEYEGNKYRDTYSADFTLKNLIINSENTVSLGRRLLRNVYGLEYLEINSGDTVWFNGEIDTPFNKLRQIKLNNKIYPSYSAYMKLKLEDGSLRDIARLDGYFSENNLYYIKSIIPVNEYTRDRKLVEYASENIDIQMLLKTRSGRILEVKKGEESKLRFTGMVLSNPLREGNNVVIDLYKKHKESISYASSSTNLGSVLKYCIG